MAKRKSHIVYRYRDKVGKSCVCGFTTSCECVLCTIEDGVYVSIATSWDPDPFYRLVDWKMEFGW